MRLDHLLSKEHTTLFVSVPDRGTANVCSRVKHQTSRADSALADVLLVVVGREVGMLSIHYRGSERTH